MKANQLLRLTTAGALAALAAGPQTHAQSSDALIDKLVEKGVLTVKEGNELREEADKGFSTAYATKSGMSDWVTALKFNGDFRGRLEGFYGDDPTFVDRTRFRYRLRFGAVANLKDNFEVGLRLGSGDLEGIGDLKTGTDPISNNQTFQNNGSKKGIFLDLAYAKWTPFNSPELGGVATIGKMENPFVFSDMVFDADYTPEGAALQFTRNLNDRHVLKLNSGAFILDELGGSSRDPFMVGAQLRYDATWSKRIATTAGLAGLMIVHDENLGNGAVPNINRGNTRNAAGNLESNLNPIVADVAVTYTLEGAPMYAGAFPIRVGADYMHNPAAHEANDAYSVGITFGKSGKRKTWDVSYTWKVLEADAWYEELVDSDFGGFYKAGLANSGSGAGYGSGTNVRGHIVKASYSPWDSLTLSVKWFQTATINEVPGGSDGDISRMQVDAVWKF